jgi:hypothetical protein
VLQALLLLTKHVLLSVLPLFLPLVVLMLLPVRLFVTAHRLQPVLPLFILLLLLLLTRDIC